MPHRVFYTMVRLTSYGIKNNLDNDSGLVGQVKAYMEGVFNMKKWFRPVRVVKKYIDIVVNIRNILIAYLKASNHEIRIYQEKSIGTSICDVMAVTDRLTGYEIKSDLDNYFRLAGQIKAYDRFFDENYLVVSKSAAMIMGKVSFQNFRMSRPARF